MNNFSTILWWKHVTFWWDDNDVPFVLDQKAELYFYSASSLKQQSTGRHVALFWNIILIPSHPVFALTPWCWLLQGEATNTNFIVWLTWPRVEPRSMSMLTITAQMPGNIANDYWFLSRQSQTATESKDNQSHLAV